MKNSRKRFEEKMKSMSDKEIHTAAQAARQAVADDNETWYQAHRGCLNFVFTAIVVICIAIVLVWFLYSGERVPVDVIVTPTPF